MTDQRIEFALPGSWQHLPVADEAVARRVIGRVAERTVGRGDERARLRAEVRARFLAAADRARSAGGESMWICDELVPGIPLPASIVLYRPALALRGSEPGSDRLAALHELLGPAGAGVDEADLVSGSLQAVRRAERVSGPAMDEPDAPTVETVQCDTWIVQPDGRSLLLLVFACGMPTLQDKLVQLFDLVVTTLQWVDAAA